MAHSVSKTSAGFEGTGEIKFSELRSTFLRKSSGSISASQLLRNTSTNLKSPIVPDCTENSGVAEYEISNGIITSEDWKVSQMRGVILRYTINQSGSDTNLNATSLTWNDNLEKNIPKIYDINGNITASLYTQDALTINQSGIINLKVDFGSGGSIKGAGGPGGGTWGQSSGGRGGNAFKFNSSGGKNNIINIPSRSYIAIAGGGGGGGKGGDGIAGGEGPVWKPRVLGETPQYTGTDDYNPEPWGEWYSYSIGGGVCDHPSESAATNACYSDPSITNQNRSILIGNTTYNTRVYSSGRINVGTYASNRKGSGCAEKCWFNWLGIKLWCDDKGKKLGPAYCAVADPVKAGGAPGGLGGNGGDGQGCDQSQSDGIPGTTGESAAGNPNYGTDGNDGITGGDGGDWGEPGRDGGTDWLVLNNWDSNPGALAYKLYKRNSNGQYEVYIDPSTSREANSVELAGYNMGKVDNVQGYWGWTSLLRTYGIYKSPTPGLNERDPYITQWLSNGHPLKLSGGSYKLEIEADGQGRVLLHRVSQKSTLNNKIMKDSNGVEIGYTSGGSPREKDIAMNDAPKIGKETIFFDVDDWVGDYYIANSIGGVGGSLSESARDYWEDQAVTRGITETKATIEGTARVEGSWDLSSQGDGITPITHNFRASVKNGEVEGASGFPGGLPGAAIYGKGYEVTEGTINSDNLRGEYEPGLTDDVEDYFTTTNEDGQTVVYNRFWQTTFKGIEYETVHEMSYSAGQTYLSLAQNVFTYVYQGTTIGTITLGTGQQEPVVSGDKRAKGGNRVIESDSWSEPSYFEIEVEQLKSYVAFEGNQLIHVYEGVNQGVITIGSGPDQQNYVENGGKRFYSGNLVIDNGPGNTNYYEIEVQEYLTSIGD